ncbi:hypothetical protein BH18ACT7_BH18ACT7_21240 [soil metagenome]
MKGVVLVAALVLFVGCGAPDTVDSARPLPDAHPGEQVTLFTDDDVGEDLYRFGISAAFPLPDGTVLMSYDLAAESAGDETPRRPRLAVLAADGVLQPVERPQVNGVEVSDVAILLAVGPDGTAYFSDRAEHGGRLVARSPDDRWRVVPAQPTTDFAGPSTAAVGPGGQLYIEDDVGLHLVNADGSLDTVVRIDGLTGSEDPGAPPLPAGQPPVPAQDVVLSDLKGLAVGPDGTVVASTRHEIVAIDQAGTLAVVTTMADLQTDLGIVSTLDPPFLWSWLAIDADGSLLVSDSYQQLVADLDGPTVVVRNAVVVSNGLDASQSPHHDLLLRVLDPDALEAGPQLPDRLAAFGR